MTDEGWQRVCVAAAFDKEFLDTLGMGTPDVGDAAATTIGCWNSLKCGNSDKDCRAEGYEP